MTPTHERDRLPLLDVLRGFALFGVLLVNLRSFSLYGFLPAADRAALPTAGVDAWLASVSALLIDGTSVTLFSILFGIGFALQTQGQGSNPGRSLLYLRRMLILLLIGTAHAWLLWWGDILRYYALLGLLLLPLVRCSAMTLAGMGLVIALLLPPLLQPVIPGLLPRQISSAESATQVLAAFSGNEWGEMLEANFARDLRMRIAVWALPAYVFGRLLIGAALGRSGVLRDVAAHARFWHRLCLGSLLLSVCLVVLPLLEVSPLAVTSALGLPDDIGRLIPALARHSAPLALALFYLSALALLFQRPAWRKCLLLLAPVGRMALSNYLAHSLIGICLFYGVGFGLGPGLGLVSISLIAVALFVMLQGASVWWLSRFRFGPMEWVWRSLTYWRWQPMRHSEAPDLAAADASVRPPLRPQ